MKEQEKEKLRRTVKILVQLDETNLLIIESGAGLLLSRQKMDKKGKMERELKM